MLIGTDLSLILKLFSLQEAQNSHVYWVSISLGRGSGMVWGWYGAQPFLLGQGGVRVQPSSLLRCRCQPFLFLLWNSGGLAQGSFFLKHELSPSQWRYCIRLENLDSDVVQLRERHWRIFSLSGTLETVRGRGVVGRVSIIGPLWPSCWSC